MRGPCRRLSREASYTRRTRRKKRVKRSRVRIRSEEESPKDLGGPKKKLKQSERKSTRKRSARERSNLRSYGPRTSTPMLL
jgi:hypothetical protein